MDNGISIFWAAFGGGAAAGIFTLIAVVVAGWFRWFLDRPLLKVSMSFGYYVYADRVDETQHIVLEGKNPHTKSVTVETLGFYYKSKELGKAQLIHGAGELPYEVQGGKSFSYNAPIQGLLDNLREHGQKPSDLKWVYMASSSGKVFRGKITSENMRGLEKAFHTQEENNAHVEEGKVQLQINQEFRKDYILLQAISCFFACFFFLRGFSILPAIWSYLSLAASIAFFLGAFILIAATFCKELPAWSGYIFGRLRPYINIATIGGIAAGLITGVVLVPHNCILFPVFFYGGFLCAILFFVRIVVSSRKLT